AAGGHSEHHLSLGRFDAEFTRLAGDRFWGSEALRVRKRHDTEQTNGGTGRRIDHSSSDGAGCREDEHDIGGGSGDGFLLQTGHGKELQLLRSWLELLESECAVRTAHCASWS